MADQITTVGIGVDTSQVTSATTALDNMAKAGNRAESATTALEKANAALVAELRGIGSGIQQLLKMAEAQKKAAYASKDLANQNAKVAATSKQAVDALNAQGAAAEKASKRSKKAPEPVSIADPNGGVRSINAELSKTATAASRASKELESLQAKARQPVNQTIIHQANTAAPVARGIPINPQSFSVEVAGANSAKAAIDGLTFAVKANTAAFVELDSKARQGLASTAAALRSTQERAQSAVATKQSVISAKSTAQTFSQAPNAIPVRVNLENISAFTREAKQADNAIEEVARDLAIIPVTGLRAVNEQLTLATANALKASSAIQSVQPKVASVSVVNRTSGQALTTSAPNRISLVTQFKSSAVAEQSALDKVTYAVKTQTKALDELKVHAKESVAATLVTLRAAATEAQRINAFTNSINRAGSLASSFKQSGIAPTAGAVNVSPAVAVLTQVQRAPNVSGTASATAPNPAILNSATRATHNLAGAQNDQAKSARLAAFQNQQLGFQLHDFFVQVASGQSPLTAFIQQGSQLSGTFGGAGNAFKAVIGLITPLRVALGGLVGVVGGLATAFIQGRNESKAFAEALVLSGNAAGQTKDKFNELSKSVEASTRLTIGQTKEAGQAIISSGLFGPETFNKATEALALFADANHKTADEVVEVFERIAQSPTKAAEELNRRLHFMTTAQYEAAKSFEDSGDSAKAQAVVLEALIAKFKGLENSMDFFDRQLVEHNKFWSNFWNTVKGIGAAETVSSELQKVEAAIKRAQSGIGGTVLPGGIVSGENINDLLLKRSQLLEKQSAEQKKAQDDAKKAEGSIKGIAATKVVDEYKKAGKATSLLTEETEKLKKAFQTLKEQGSPVSAEDQKSALEGVKKRFGNTGGAGRGNSEAGQILRAQLDRDIKGIIDAFQKERDEISFNERFLQGEYQAGRTSLEELYKGKREAIQKGVDAEVKELEDENKRLAQFLKQSKDPSEREQTQTRINENNDDISRARLNAARDLKLVNQEEEASFRQLTDSIANYEANLLQLQGDEEGAARKRAQVAIEQARVLSAQSVRNGQSPIDVEGLAKATEIQTQFNEVQRRTQFISSAARTAEEAFARAAEQRGLSQKDADTGVYLIRQKELEQLGALAAKAKELADASTDPRIKQFAAELANEYAKAAAAVDPALQRLRDANKELAQGLTSTVGNLPNAFAEAYKKRRDDSYNDIKSQKDEYSRRIDILEGYLAESQDKQDKARLREKIKNLESERDSKKQKSKGSALLGALNDSLIQPAVQQVTASLNKLLIADPLQKMIEGQLKSLTEGDGALAGFFKDALGIKTDPKQLALDAQTAAVVQSTSALDLLTQAAQNAAGALPSAQNPANSLEPTGVPQSDSFSPDLFDEFGNNLEQTNDANVDLAKTVPSVTNVLTKLAGASSMAGQALGILPSIISLISSATAASSASSAGGGLFGAIASMFGGSSGSGTITNELFHDGGIVGSPTAYRTTATSVFNNATRYHTGGLAGLKADEVPAILMGGGKGKREEVLKADDPRHRDNLGFKALAAIMHESKYNAMRPRGNRALGGDVASNSLYRVNENKPELLEVAGQQYLMMGNQAGSVKQTDENQKKIELHMHFNNGNQPVDRRTADQVAAAAAAGVRRANMRNN